MESHLTHHALASLVYRNLIADSEFQSDLRSAIKCIYQATILDPYLFKDMRQPTQIFKQTWNSLTVFSPTFFI